MSNEFPNYFVGQFFLKDKICAFNGSDITFEDQGANIFRKRSSATSPRKLPFRCIADKHRYRMSFFFDDK